MYNEIEYSTKPDINDNRYSVIFNPKCLWFMRGTNISTDKPDKYYSRKHIDEIVDSLINHGYFETNRQIDKYHEQQKIDNQIKSKPVVECPYCHSTNTKKISGISKAGSVALFGVFAVGKVSKQWHCNNCNSDF